MSDIIDISALCQPISDENPTGPDLRADNATGSLYYKLREARAAARAIERSNTAKKPDDLAPNPHWKKIIELAPQVLQQSKDLEVAAWYTEALLREQNFEGLSTGFTLLHKLIETYGDKLYPALDEEEGLLDSTFAPLAGLNGSGSTAGTLISPINCVLITQSSAPPNFATWQYTQSLNLARAPNETVRQDRIKNGVPTMATLLATAQSTSTAFYETLLKELNSAIENYEALIKLLDEKFSSSSIPSSNIKNALLSCRKAIQNLAKDKLGKSDSNSVPDEAGTAGTTVQTNSQEITSSVSLSSGGTLENRKKAIETLQVLIDFFEQTEPHSPMAAALKRIKRWTDMDYADLMEELLRTQPPMVFEDIAKITGVEKKPLPPPPMPAPPAGGNAPYDYAAPAGGGFDPYANPQGQQPGSFGAPSPYGGMPSPGGYDPMAGNNFGGGGMPPAGGGGFGGGFGNNGF
jgi:type VI secretion system protein ImpA